MFLYGFEDSLCFKSSLVLAIWSFPELSCGASLLLFFTPPIIYLTALLEMGLIPTMEMRDSWELTAHGRLGWYPGDFFQLLQWWWQLSFWAAIPRTERRGSQTQPALPQPALPNQLGPVLAVPSPRSSRVQDLAGVSGWKQPRTPARVTRPTATAAPAAPVPTAAGRTGSPPSAAAPTTRATGTIRK